MAVVEKKVFPREKTCGDGLTPRSVRQIADMGIEGALTGAHRYSGLRAHAYGKVLDLPWPEHPTFPSYGYVITRHDLDAIVNERAVKAGATVWQGTEAVEPILDEAAGPAPAGAGGCRLRGRSGQGEGHRSPPATVRARYVVVADGANSRFGRALGTARDRAQPMGMALRGYYSSPGHDQTFIESHLDIRDGEGNVVPGYGWIFPLGDGRVNVGVGLLSTDRRWKGVNTSTLMDHFVAWAPKEWELSPATASARRPAASSPWAWPSGRGSGPPPWWSVTRPAPSTPSTARASPTATRPAGWPPPPGRGPVRGGVEALLRYEDRLEEAYGLYYRVARAFIRVISRPELMQLCVGTGMYSETLMSWILRIMANLLRPDETGPAEAAYRAAGPHRPPGPRRRLSREPTLGQGGAHRCSAWATRPATALKAELKASDGTDGPLVVGSIFDSMRPPIMNPSPMTSLPWPGMASVVR